MDGNSAPKGEKMGGEPAVGVPGYAYPYPAPPPQMAPPQQMPPPQYYYTPQHPHASGMVPGNAIVDNPGGIPLQSTFYGDTPAPFHCPKCGMSGQTIVRSTQSLATYVACAGTIIFVFGICFLFPQYDCLWHKKHICPNCHEEVAEFRKNDPCLVADPASWTERSYAIPA